MDQEYIDLSRSEKNGMTPDRLLRRAAEVGQSMVEMAFILPLFLVMVISIIEIGRAWAVKQSLTIAAREGARILVLPYGAGLPYGTESAVKAAALDAVTNSLNNSGVPVGNGTVIKIARVTPGNDHLYGTPDDVYEVDYTDGKRGERIGIDIKHNFDTALPLILGMFGETRTNTGIKMGAACFMDHE